MKIIRDGKEYELTAEELLNAYLEQEAIYDYANIRDNMEGYLSPDEFERLKNNESFIERAADKLRENQDDSGMGYDDALALAFDETAKDFRLSVNRVSIIRERLSEREIWSDDFWVDATQTPSKELFQKAVETFLITKDGQEAVDATCNDFNWGDAMIYVPDEIWNKFGIYPFDLNYTPEDRGLAPTSSANLVKIQVNQDEILIPDNYLDRLEAIKVSNGDSSRFMKAVDIQWDVDSEEEMVLLPFEIEIPKGMENVDDIADYLSDLTGFCHKGFRIIDCNKKDSMDLSVEPVKPSLSEQIQCASSRAAEQQTSNKNPAKEFTSEL